LDRSLEQRSRCYFLCDQWRVFKEPFSLVILTPLANSSVFSVM
jgi:hypothetical protein